MYRRRRRLSGRFIALLAALAIGVLVYFISGVLAFDEDEDDTYITDDNQDWQDGDEFGFRFPVGPPDIALLQTNFDNAAMVYMLYYVDMPMDLSRHIIVDDENLVRFVTYSARYNSLSINTRVPVVVRTFYEHNTGNIYINVLNPRAVHDMIVVIDPGHGGLDGGVIVGGHNESDIVLAISLMLYGLFLLSDSGITAFMTRHDDSWVFNAQRSYVANTIGDLFLSVHTNSYVYDTQVTGTETLYRPGGLMETIGNTGRINLTNAEFSQIAQDHLVAELGTRDRGIRERTELLLLNTSTIPTAYVEIDFITNPSVLADLLDPAYQLRVATALYRAVVEAFAQEEANRP